MTDLLADRCGACYPHADHIGFCWEPREAVGFCPCKVLAGPEPIRKDPELTAMWERRSGRKIHRPSYEVVMG